MSTDSTELPRFTFNYDTSVDKSEITKHELITFGQYLNTVENPSDDKFIEAHLFEMCKGTYERIKIRMLNNSGKVKPTSQWYVLGDNELIGPFKTKREASEMYPDMQVWKVAK